MSAVFELSVAPAGGWRVPSRADFQLLFASGEHRHCTYFNDLRYLCWARDEHIKKPKFAYFAYMASGCTSADMKNVSHHTRLIRDASDDEKAQASAYGGGRFVLSECRECVIDRLTGIVWRRRVEKFKCNWFEAMQRYQ